MSGGGHRSKFSLLPFEARYRAYALLQDGATIKSLLSDPEIARALARTGATLNSANLTRIRKSKEYLDHTRRRIETQNAWAKDQATTMLLRENEGAQVIADQTKVALLKALSGLSDLSDMEEGPDKVKAARSLAQSVVTLSNSAKDNQISDLKRQLREEKELRVAELEAKDKIIAEIRKLAAERYAQIEKLKERLSKIGAENSGAVINEMDKFVKGG